MLSKLQALYGAPSTFPVHFNSRVRLCSHSFGFLICPLRMGVFDKKLKSKLCYRSLENSGSPTFWAPGTGFPEGRGGRDGQKAELRRASLPRGLVPNRHRPVPICDLGAGDPCFRIPFKKIFNKENSSYVIM